MLTNYANVLNYPGLNNAAQATPAWINSLIQSADDAIKKYCKRDLELNTYVEYHDGDGEQKLILRQKPVWSGMTTLTQAISLPTTTLPVTSTLNFDPGTNPTGGYPQIGVQTGVNTWVTVTYTGITGTSFTGCSGGTGTTYIGGTVFNPLVYYNPLGFYGYGTGTTGGFNDGDLFTMGSQYAPVIDTSGGQGKSARGYLKRIGGDGQGFGGFYFGQRGYGGGKLAGNRPPGWPRGDGNLKVVYSAGYAPGSVPYDLVDACTMLVAQMIRINPNGANVSSENLGGYSYSVLYSSQEPEMGDLRRRLAPYRETSLGSW